MAEIKFIHNMEEFLEYNQIIKLLRDQMDYIESPKTNEEIMNTFKMAFRSETAKLMVLHKNGHPVGFIFFNIAIGMESAGKYIWLNEMHVHSAYRGKGYGTQLFNRLKDYCVENGILRILGMADDSESQTLHFYQNQDCKTYPQQIFSYHIKK
ncbi:GNAT family N-acetyltransferase [Candidatus Xianfuyuplasma coldseepsis]|uniref:GNAT family N-acetyltransferase n=1 Tax=Candidatus Xianfuyuplasma coldseepsis TaxID=2782163 RepID=A0A7L7KPB6_9MOLU|nr:GNAT family N-acetyltransferase [Xianfuyuplasma coldseepsis]QMS84630.1 GNAT family N-acetyltransferase [Xianfuyuplasma coldseepsis]